MPQFRVFIQQFVPGRRARRLPAVLFTIHRAASGRWPHGDIELRNDGVPQRSLDLNAVDELVFVLDFGDDDDVLRAEIRVEETERDGTAS